MTPALTRRLVVVVLVVAGFLGGAASAQARTGAVQLGAAINDHGYQHGPPAYLQTLARYDATTPESAMNIFSLQPAEGRWEWGMADQLVNWSSERGQRVHGVPLIWCSDEWTPKWVLDKAWTRESMLAWIGDYVRTVVRRYRGKVSTWDVVNEAFNPDGTTRDCVWSRVLGMDYVEHAFRAARAADAGTTLLYNEYAAENPASRKFLATERLVADFKARGVPLDGVGLQFHLFGTGPFQWQLEEAFARLAAKGMQVHISEMDVPMNFLPGPTTQDKVDQQAQTYSTVAAACQAQPACFRLTTWGFTDAYSFRGVENASLPFDTSYREKPAWHALQRILRTPAARLGNRIPSAAGRPAAPATGSGTFTLTWSPALDLDGEQVTYTVQHRDADDAAWSTVATGVRGAAYAFRATQQERQGTWTYRVRASDAATDGAWSEPSGASKVDRVVPAPPVISTDRAPEDPAGWFRSRVTTAIRDGGDPVLPDGSPGSGVDPASLPAPSTFATSGSHTTSGSVRDRAGNASAVASRTVRVDAQAPAVTLRCPAGPVAHGSAAEATWSATDPHSGVSPAEGMVALDTTTAGPRTATTAVADRAGLRTSASCAYEVAAAPQAEPTPTEPTPAQQTPTAPAPAEPAQTEPDAGETTPTQRTPTEPAPRAQEPAPAPAETLRADEPVASSSTSRTPGTTAVAPVVLQPAVTAPVAAPVRPSVARRVRLDARGRLRLAVRCPASAGVSACRGKLVLRLRTGDRRRGAVLGKAALTLRAGRTQTVTVGLTPDGRRRLRTRRPVSADVRFADRAAGSLVVLPLRRR